MSEILSGEELIALTGSSRTEKQKEVLRANSITYFLDAKQRPVVIWSAVRRIAESTNTNESPNFEALEHAAAAAKH